MEIQTTNVEITAKVELITPEIAKNYLEHNTNNRKENKGHVAYLAKQMAEEGWGLNGETIVFDWNGDLCNGQHRLKACILANVPFTTLVVRGVDPKVFATFDSGYKRTSAQVFEIGGIANGMLVSSVIGAFCKMTQVKGNYMRNCDSSNHDAYKSTRTSNSELLEIYNEDPEFWQGITKKARNCYKRCRLINASQIGAITAYLIKNKGYRADYVWEFIDQIFYDELTELECIKTLRRRLIDDAMAGAKFRLSQQYKEQLIIICWEHYKKGTDSKYLRWTSGINESKRWE